MPDTFTSEQIAQILEAFFATVGTRQYIGARYVPIFGRKNETSIEWDNSAPYEQLTVVLYQGNSFTSRQYVPAGVEITNETFWAETGNFNGQVEQYRQETAQALQTAQDAQESADNAQGDIDTLLPKSAFSAENTVKDYIDGKVDEIDALLPRSAFSSENTVKDYVDEKMESYDYLSYYSVGKEPITILKDSTLIEEVGSLPDGYIYQGMAIYDGFIYVIGYPATSANSTLFKIALDTLDVVNAYDFAVYVHGNSVNIYNNLILVCDTTRGYYLFNTELELVNYYNPYQYGTTNRNASFCVFSDNRTAISTISGRAGNHIMYEDIEGVFTSFGIFRNEIGAYGYQDMCTCMSLVAELYGARNINAINLYKKDGSIYKTLYLPSFGNEELEGISYLEDVNSFYISTVSGKLYSVDVSEVIANNSTNINQLSGLLYGLQPFWCAPANAQGVLFGDVLLCTNTAGTRNTYVQRNIRKKNIQQSANEMLVWQFNTGAYLGGAFTGGAGLRVSIPVYSQSDAAYGIGIAYVNNPTYNMQALNIFTLFDITNNTINRVSGLANLDNETFIESFKTILDSVPMVTTSNNVFGAARTYANNAATPEVVYIKLV